MEYRRRIDSAAFIVFCILVLAPPIARAQQLTVTHFAGSVGGRGSNDGLGQAARFNFDASQGYVYPAVAVDGAGNVYLADSSNNTIRKITSSGVVMTLAGLAGVPGQFADGTGSAARFDSPSGIAVDRSGNVFVADGGNNIVRKITPAGVVTTFAGAWSRYNTGSADGTGGAAQFAAPTGLAIDASGNIYVADTGNGTIRKITPGGVVTTLAGTAGVTGWADGTGAAAQFSRPTGVAVDSNGNVYVADADAFTIRKITPTGVVTTLAGTANVSGKADGTGAAAQFLTPESVAVDSGGNVWVADLGGQSIRKITPGGVVTTFAGGDIPGTADGIGAAAHFADPIGIAVDSSGNLYVSDGGNHTIRKITTGAVVTTFAGTAIEYGTTDGTGSGARFNSPSGVAVDNSGNVYVGDSSNNTIRKITPAGVVTTLAGAPGISGNTDGVGSAARFSHPTGTAVDSAGNVYVADTNNNTIRKITPTGIVTTFAGTGFSGGQDGAGTSASFYDPNGLAIDSSGNLYVADTGNTMIRKITPSGVVTTFAGSWGGFGTADGTGSAAQFYYPHGVAVDGTGNVYVADTVNNTIRKITAGGVVTTLAGSPPGPGGADGTGSAAGFYNPYGIAVDAAGNLWVTDVWSRRIRKVTPGGVVTSVAGTYGTPGSTDGTGTDALFGFPEGIAIDSSGNLYIADNEDHCIRKARLPIADAATIDAATGTTFQTRVLGTTPNTASSWSWSLIRRPVGSSTGFSSTTVQSPTFTPDAPDLYVFQVEASSSSGSRISTVSLMAAPFTGPFPSGDTNGDGVVNVRDVFYLINNLFGGGPAPVGSADVNGDGHVNTADVIYLINYLYAGGSAPH